MCVVRLLSILSLGLALGASACSSSGAAGSDEDASPAEDVLDDVAVDGSGAGGTDAGADDAGGTDAGDEDAVDPDADTDGGEDAGPSPDAASDVTGDAASDATEDTASDTSPDAEADAGDPAPAPCTAPWCSDADPETTPPEAVCRPGRRIVEWADHAPVEGRFQRSEPVPSEPVVQDIIGEVMWTACPYGLRGSDCEQGTIETLRFNGTIDEACENLTWGGYDDWELPPHDVLRSIYNPNEGNPRDAYAIWSGEVQPTLRSPRYIFGARIYVNGVLDEAYRARLDTDQYMVRYDSRSEFATAFCVRATGSRALADTVERCVLPPAEGDNEPVYEDLSTGLSWQGCAVGFFGPDCSLDAGAVDINDPQEAAEVCGELVWDGFDDWRIPSEMEASTLEGMQIFERATFVTSGFSAYQGPQRRIDWDATRWGGSTGGGSLGLSNNPGRAIVQCVRGQDRWSDDRWPDEPTERCRLRGTPLGSWGGSLEDRFTRDQPVPGEPVVADAHLGAEWTGCLAGQTGNSCGGGAAQNRWRTPDLRAYCEGLEWGGHEDWRAPSLDEVFTIAGPGEEDTLGALLPNVPSQYLATGWYWTDSDDDSFAVSLDGSGVALPRPGSSGPVGGVCIRGGVADTRAEECATSTIGVFSEPVVSVASTGLDWTGCVAGESGRFCELTSATEPVNVTLNVAVQRCDDLDYGGFDDWRLPTFTELRDLLDMSSGQPSPIDGRVFGNGVRLELTRMWSATPVAQSSGEDWYPVGVPNFTLRPSNQSASHLCVRSRE